MYVLQQSADQFLVNKTQYMAACDLTVQKEFYIELNRVKQCNYSQLQCFVQASTVFKPQSTSCLCIKQTYNKST